MMSPAAAPSPSTDPGTITASQSRTIAALMFDLYPVLTAAQTNRTVRDMFGRQLLLSDLSEREAGDVLLHLDALRRRTKT